MRWLVTVLWALLLTGPLSGEALAAKGRKGNKARSAQQQAPSLRLQRVGVQGLDAMFDAARAPVRTVRQARSSVDEVPSSLTGSLQLSPGTAFPAALRELRSRGGDALQLGAGRGVLPQLSASDAAPTDVQGAVQALNASLGDASAAVTGLAGVPKQLLSISKAVGKLDLASFTSGLSLTEGPQMVAKVTSNLKVLADARNEPQRLVASLGHLQSSMRSAFNPGAKRGKGKGKRKGRRNR